MPPKTRPAPVSPLDRHRLLSPTANIKVSPLCLGAMTFGEKQPETYGAITKSTVWEILDRFYSQGGNFIDTANVYQQGQSEEWLGEWMAERGNRDEIVLATKYSGAFPGAKKGGKVGSNWGGNGSKSLKLNFEGSLRRLRTSYVDLYYVHWWDYATPIPELMHALNDLVTSGKVLYLGISDTPAWIVSKANEYARQNGLRQFVIYQGFWNAGLRDLERDIIPMCRAEGMAIAPYGVLGQGRFQTPKVYEERAKSGEGRKMLPLTEKDKAVSKILGEIAEEKGEGVTLHHIAQAYVMQKTTYVFPIIGLRKVEHLDGAIEGLKVALTDEDIDRIDSAYDFDHGFPHTFLSGSMFDGSRPWPAQHPEDVWLGQTFGAFDYVESEKPLRPKQ